MTALKCSRLASAFAATFLSLAMPMGASAGPMSFVRSETAQRSPLIEEARARVIHRRVRRSGVPQAVLGLFGAALGAAIASDRYDNYSYYSYGYPNGYGYNPGYVGAPGRAGGARGHFGGGRGASPGRGPRGGGAGRAPGARH
jgi:hypothetical protein